MVSNQLYIFRSNVPRLALAGAIITLLAAGSVSVAQPSQGQAEPLSSSVADSSVVTFDPGFFSRYKPNTALDMVSQLPGFQLDDGDADRGFIGAVGNILIDGKYPGIKQDSPSALLNRIPANRVARIELIRGQAPGIDLRGQAVVANIILQDHQDVAVRWETFIQHSNTGPWKPVANISLAHRIGNTEYNAGINIERESNGEVGTEIVYDQNGAIVEDRYDDIVQTGLKQMDILLNTSSTLSETLLRFNGKFSIKNGPENRISTRTPHPNGDPYEVLFRTSQNQPSFELGLNAERRLGEKLGGKAILLYTYNDQDLRNLQSNANSAGVQTSLRIAETTTITREAISRLEFGWSGWTDHSVQFNLEGAYNSVDGSLLQTLDTGNGPQIVAVPGANTLVEEYRADVMLKDTWKRGLFEIDYGLAAEFSNISQTGDTDQERDFSFLKPRLVMTWTPENGRQSRLQLYREVAQLDFNDFISATVFEDNDLALGNPDLRPDTTWIAELSQEYRFGRLGVVRAGVFHHWISDVLDLLPLSDNFEAPGNIGDGRRWGLTLETTLPLDRLGLAGARLDLKGRWQDSTVIDPVTGESRVLSGAGGFGGPPTIRFRDNGNRYVYDMAYRQDFEAARFAWGWDIASQATRTLFKVNELDSYDEELELNAFIETTRWFGIKIRLEGNNLLNYTETRERILFDGARDLSAIDSTILRDRKPGRRIKLVLSGSF